MEQHRQAFVSKIVVGGTWRHKRTGDVVAINQIHRKDGLVLVISHEGAREYLSFARLKRYYDPIEMYV